MMPKAFIVEDTARELGELIGRVRDLAKRLEAVRKRLEALSKRVDTQRTAVARLREQVRSQCSNAGSYRPTSTAASRAAQ